VPSHICFLIHTNLETCKTVKPSLIEINALTEGLRLLLSSYSKGVQKQRGFVGNFFQQKTKSKCVDIDDSNYYATTAFHYIHQNPRRAGLERNDLDSWQFSSLNEYMKYGNTCMPLRNNTESIDIHNICNRKLAYEISDLTLN